MWGARLDTSLPNRPPSKTSSFEKNSSINHRALRFPIGGLRRSLVYRRFDFVVVDFRSIKLLPAKVCLFTLQVI